MDIDTQLQEILEADDVKGLAQYIIWEMQVNKKKPKEYEGFYSLCFQYEARQCANYIDYMEHVITIIKGTPHDTK